eukprot:1161835-Pelagomonas_calceolata.AAC.14
MSMCQPCFDKLIAPTAVDAYKVVGAAPTSKFLFVAPGLDCGGSNGGDAFGRRSKQQRLHSHKFIGHGATSLLQHAQVKHYRMPIPSVYNGGLQSTQPACSPASTAHSCHTRRTWWHVPWQPPVGTLGQPPPRTGSSGLAAGCGWDGWQGGRKQYE